MLGRFRRLCQPTLASQTTQSVIAVATSSRALYNPLCVETEGDLQDSTDPYLYTTWRWLNRDKLQREARYVKFDFPALCKQAVNTCSGATNVIRYEKKEGGFNKVFIYTWTMESAPWLEYPFALQVREDWSPMHKRQLLSYQHLPKQAAQLFVRRPVIPIRECITLSQYSSCWENLKRDLCTTAYACLKPLSIPAPAFPTLYGVS